MAVVGILSRRIGMVDQQLKGFIVRVGCGVLQHRQIAIAVAESRNRALPHKQVDRHRLGRGIIIKCAFHRLAKLGAIVRQTKLAERERTDNLLRRDTVHFLRYHAHEVNSTAGNDPRFKTIGAQIVQQLAHRLISQLVVATAGTFILMAVKPCADPLTKLFGGHAAMG